jgi:hypothetical protein
MRRIPGAAPVAQLPAPRPGAKRSAVPGISSFDSFDRHDTRFRIAHTSTHRRIVRRFDAWRARLFARLTTKPEKRTKNFFRVAGFS